MDILLRSAKGVELTHGEMDANVAELDRRTLPGWFDLTAGLVAAGVPPASAPTLAAFGPSGLRQERAYAINDYQWLEPFHVNHNIKPGGMALVHVHWSTNGTSAAVVKWELQIMRSRGHNQENFVAPVTKYVSEAAHGTAWRHMTTEVDIADALTLHEPDELFLVTLRRVTNGGVDNADNVFGLTVDFHIEIDRDSTPQRAPDFYAL